ncbi:MAG: hypothetical protein M3452_10815 [Chloroflexota bacterium]|nr:hypothetical protein [Chloroflexota bacterium]
MDDRTDRAATTDETQAPEQSGREAGPSGTWGGGTAEGAQGGQGAQGGEGGQGGYGGGSTGFDEPPAQGLGGETSTGPGANADLDDPALRDPAGLKGSEGSASGDAATGSASSEAGMSDEEIEEQPRGA